MASSYTKAEDWNLYLGGDVDCASDSFKIALSNTAPGSETSDPTADGNGILANVTQISYTNYSDDMGVDRTLEGVSWTDAAGVATLAANHVTITPSGGALADFRYIYVYDDTVAGDPIVAVWDYGATVSLPDGQPFELDFGADGGTAGTIFTLT